MKNILVVDDHLLIFEGLKNQNNNFNWLYSSNIKDAEEIIEKENIYACIIDITLQNESGFSLAFKIKDKILVFILTMHRRITVIQISKAMGVKGFFLKDEELDLLFEALKNPNLKKFWINPGLEIRETASSKFSKLSPREKEVFVLLAEGLNYKEIGVHLGLSPKTVNIYKDNIKKKLNLKSNIDILKLAINLNIYRPKVF